MAWEYYSFLGISPEAEWDEIKRASARKRRELEISKDAKGKAYLNEVNQVLRNPQTREDYDILQRYGDKILKLLEKVRKAVDQEDWPQAISLARKALERVPDHPLIQSELAFALAENGNFRESEKTYGDLVKRYPNNAVHWASYGSVCFDLAARTPEAEARIPGRTDLILTGIQSAKRNYALEKIAEVIKGSFEDAKALVKTAPQPLLTMAEQPLLDSFTRQLRAAGVLTKQSPSLGLAMRCPICRKLNFLPSDFSGRKATCSICFSDFTVYRGDRQELLARGRENLQRAIALDPTNSDYYLDVARSFSTEDDYAQAAGWVNQAIAADGQEDYDDPPALAELCRLYSLQGEQALLDATVRRMQTVLPPGDPEIQEFASSLLASAALLAHLHQRFDVVSMLANASMVFTPDDKAPREIAESAAKFHQVQQELQRLTQDLQVIDPIKDMARLMVAEATRQVIDPRLAEQLDTAFDTIYNFTRNIIRASAKRVKSRYPAIYEIMQSIFTQLIGDAL